METTKNLKRVRAQAFSNQSQEITTDSGESTEINSADDSTEDDDGIKFIKKKLKLQNDEPKTFQDFTKLNEEIHEEQIDQSEQSESSVHKEVFKLVSSRFGIIQKNFIVLTEEAPFYVRCCFKHIWGSTLKTIRHHWCPKCDVLLEKARKQAEQNDCELLSQFYGPSLTYRCKVGHTWCQELKKYNKKGCQVCKKTRKEQIKMQEEFEEQKRMEELKQKQNKLFEEAKINFVSEESKTGYYEEEKKNESNLVEKNKVASAFKRMEGDIENLIRKSLGLNLPSESKFISEAKGVNDLKSCSDNLIGDSESLKEKQINEFIHAKKMLLIPEDAFKLYLKNLSKDSLKSEYYSWAKLIHPDKNSDPNSGQAFVKLNKIYEGVLKGI